jgi:hypothetical protein
MTADTKSLSERLRTYRTTMVGVRPPICTEAADALDAQAAEIELLKEGRKLHDEWADHVEEALAAIRAKEHP